MREITQVNASDSQKRYLAGHNDSYTTMDKPGKTENYTGILCYSTIMKVP